MTRRAKLLLWSGWILCLCQAYALGRLSLEVERLQQRPVVVYPQQARVAQLEDRYNAMKNERDYWKATAEGRVVTE